MITSRIFDFFKNKKLKTPYLVLDLEIVRQNFYNFRQAMPTSEVYYAIKANPHPRIIKLLVDIGSCFDCASVEEIEMALAVGAKADRLSYGNTIKKEIDIKKAYSLGVKLFAVDSFEEVKKISLVASDVRVFCRILYNGQGAEWPLSCKFGCVPEMAVKVLLYANLCGLEAYGVSFHVGSQMTRVDAWDSALVDVKYISEELSKKGIHLKMINLGGGFPIQYLNFVPSIDVYGKAIQSSIQKYFGNSFPFKTIIEPGRAIVANAGAIKSEVVLISRKSEDDPIRWVFLDIGKFGGLAETTDEAIRYKILTNRDTDEMSPCIIAGPTCDSADILYKKKFYPIPISLAIGDEVFIEGTGAYTSTYASVAFNGFEPLKSYVI
ncbi:type III PLP-dependent enzyme [Liberibacter crescens]|uniref:type III PLP-dependent enzyme n=1 Tax=Liberibacter crescens TaxID=1273132 RepID=UPI0005A26B5B|nr:ornithine decarboxylase [Liberibacter crescens]